MEGMPSIPFNKGGSAATVHPRKEEEVFSSHRTTQPDLLSAIF